MREEIIALKFENRKLKDTVYKLTNELSLERRKVKVLEERYDKYVQEESLRFEKAINKAIKGVKKEYQKIVDELQNKILKLESQLNINSTNSSLPSSKNKINVKIPNNREKSDKPIGGQVGHKAHKLNYFKPEEITRTEVHELDKCPDCEGTLVETNTVTSDILDFDIQISKTRNIIHNYKCSCCGKRVSANSKLPRAASYGDNINATAIDLMNTSNVAFNKVAKHIRGITNNEINMSEGYLAKLQRNSANKLDSFIEDLKNHIITLPVVHWDDATCKAGDKETYTRFYGDDNFALLIAHESKNKEGIEKDNILNRLNKNTTCVHDHVLLNYSYEFKNAECNVHICRYLKGVKDNIHNHTWQDKMRDLLINSNKDKNDIIEKHKTDESISLSFSDEYLNNVSSKYDEYLKLGFKENKKLLDSHFYKKDELNLLTRLQKYKDSHLLYLYDFNVPFSNNTAERGLRKVKRKLAVAFAFKNFTSQCNYAKILSYLETCERNGISKFVAARRLVSGNPYSIQEILDISKSS